MTSDRNYGSPDGLSKRLKAWTERLAKDKSLSFPGLGLIEDLKAAADVLDGKPVRKAVPVEFDL